MDSEELEFIHLILNLAPSQNPYQVSTSYLQIIITQIRLDPWARQVLIVMIVAYLIMYFQCLHLIYTKSITSSFRFCRWTQSGLLRLDVSTLCSVIFFLYCPLVITDLILQLQIELGHRDLTHKLVLMGSKFSVLLTGFLWICVCQCIATRGEEFRTENVKQCQPCPRLLRWILSGFFLIGTFGPLPCFVWLGEMSNLNYLQIRQLYDLVSLTLNRASKDYDPNSYHPIHLFKLLLPARQMFIYRDELVHYLRCAAWLGLIELCILGLLYIPFMIWILQDLNPSTHPVKLALEDPIGPPSIQVPMIRNRLTGERRLIFQHTLVVYLTMITFIPVLASLIIMDRGSFTRNKALTTWIQLGLHGPFAITGNVIQVILNLQARRYLLWLRNPQSPFEPTIGNLEID